MAYVIEKMEQQLQDALSAPAAWVERNPIYRGFFDSNAELRAEHAEPGVKLHTPEWKHVASFPSTLRDAMEMVDDQRFIRDKKRFYSWLKRNRAYCVYDAKFGGA